MGIPILSEIIITIQKVVDWVQRTIPRAVQFLFFLLFLLFIGNTIFPMFFNIIGTFCLDDDKFTNDFYDVPTNINTMIEIRNLQDSNVSGTILVESDCIYNVNESGTTKRYYDGGFCTNCTQISVGDPEYHYDGPFSTNIGYCKADAWPIPREEKTIFQKWQCENVLATGITSFFCEPPPHFYYDFALGGYKCGDDSCLNVTESTLYKNTLLEKGFTAIPSTFSDTPPIVGTKCFGNNPKFVVVGLDLFNFQIWLFILFISLILIVWFKFR